jgi:hypothetical protein
MASARGALVRPVLGTYVRVLAALGLIAALVLVPTSGAVADQTPAGCTQNNLTLDIGRDRTVVRNGDTINYTVSVSNVDSAQGPACDITGATVVFIAPAADGTDTGAHTVLRSNINFPAGTTQTVLGTVPYVVSVNPGVTDTVAAAMANGVLHDAPVNDQAQVVKTLGSTVTQPHTTLSASVTVTAAAPLTLKSTTIATYTYLEHNDSTTPDPMVSETVTDDACAPVRLVSGDTNASHILEPGATWTYTCSRTLPGPGVYVDHVKAGGVDAADNRAAPPEAAVVSTTVAEALAEALPVTGPPVPLVPVGAAGAVALGAGLTLNGLGRRARRGRAQA